MCQNVFFFSLKHRWIIFVPTLKRTLHLMESNTSIPPTQICWTAKITWLQFLFPFVCIMKLSSFEGAGNRTRIVFYVLIMSLPLWIASLEPWFCFFEYQNVVFPHICVIQSEKIQLCPLLSKVRLLLPRFKTHRHADTFDLFSIMMCPYLPLIFERKDSLNHMLNWIWLTELILWGSLLFHIILWTDS